MAYSLKMIFLLGTVGLFAGLLHAVMITRRSARAIRPRFSPTQQSRAEWAIDLALFYGPTQPLTVARIAELHDNLPPELIAAVLERLVAEHHLFGHRGADGTRTYIAYPAPVRGLAPTNS